MAVKQCPKCKTVNPGIYTHCIRCGTPLTEPAHSTDTLKTVLSIVVIVIVAFTVLYLAIPALHFSAASGRNMSKAISSEIASPSPVPEYPVNQPVRYGNLQVTVTQVRQGDDTFNSGRFCIVTISVQNMARDTAYSLPAGDFVLADAKGNYYYSTGIGSKVSYDAGPKTSGTADLVYIVPRDAEDLRLYYTFPASSEPEAGRQEVSFVF